MSQQADIQPNSLEHILEILRNQAIAMPTSSTSSRYLRALASLQSSALHFPYSATSADRTAAMSEGETSSAHIEDDENSSFIIHHLSLSLTDWLVSLWLMNTPFTTASLYLDIISSLYGSAVKANLLPPTKLFSQLKTDLKTLGPDDWKKGIDDEIFDRALRLTRNAVRLIADDAIAASIVIWSLTHSLQPLSEIALLKKCDLSANTTDSSLIVNRSSLKREDPSLIVNRSSLKKSRYAFPLRQSQRTPRQLQAHISKIVNDLFRRARLPQATDPYQTVEALWAYAALRAGIPASTIISFLGHAPLGLPVLKLSSSSSRICDNAENADNEKSLSQVGKVFLDNPPQWYAMSLRPGVRFTQVCRRIQLLSTSNAQRPTYDDPPELFYPCEEIARTIGKKIVTRQRPFIHSVVFFRAKLTDIGRLFVKIGDLAWCYRQNARPGAPYAAISDAQFRLFQQTIAQFTPDYEVASTGELELNEGDRVE
ncbi:MAG: hypothetical protein K2K23_05135, partial [Muribaculaceae bacterium]|nr:hypothetical protein [Muribaculaceae bacterium]